MAARTASQARRRVMAWALVLAAESESALVFGAGFGSGAGFGAGVAFGAAAGFGVGVGVAFGVGCRFWCRSRRWLRWLWCRSRRCLWRRCRLWLRRRLWRRCRLRRRFSLRRRRGGRVWRPGVTRRVSADAVGAGCTSVMLATEPLPCVSTLTGLADSNNVVAPFTMRARTA